MVWRWHQITPFSSRSLQLEAPHSVPHDLFWWQHCCALFLRKPWLSHQGNFVNSSISLMISIKSIYSTVTDCIRLWDCMSLELCCSPKFNLVFCVSASSNWRKCNIEKQKKRNHSIFCACVCVFLRCIHVLIISKVFRSELMSILCQCKHFI